MNIAIIMMQKNEGDMLGDWIEYHASLVGRDNLYIFDNGSTDEKTLSILSDYESSGVYVDYTKNKKEHFIGKGKVVLSKIKDLEKLDRYEYFFPMDCDEFLACLDDRNDLSIDISDIKKVLKGLNQVKEVLAIKHAYSDSPVHADYFLPQMFRKTFFKANTCAFLDEGFHNGKTHETDVKAHTKIVYFHLHNKPHSEWLAAAQEKLRERITDFSRESLQNFFDRKGPGFHLIPKMLMSKAEFEDFYKVDGRVHFPEFRKKLSRLKRNAFEDPLAGPFNQDRDLVGYIDRIKFHENFITASGWGYLKGGHPIREFIPMIDGNRIPVWSLSRTNRVDVQKKYPEAPEECGFSITVELPKIFSRLELCSSPDEKGLLHALVLTERSQAALNQNLR